ncbi:MAG TPA: hypothetical protein VD704_04110 [Gaiellaceae bacterium]|nr:hypothetical protein [Gaiellaceae bacterium]
MAESTDKPEAARVRGVERSLQVRLGGLGGFELRPTRVFLWGGADREGHERILPLGSAPRSLSIPRRPREVEVGALEVKALGNPLMTIALAGVHAARAVGRKVREPS